MESSLPLMGEVLLESVCEMFDGKYQKLGESEVLEAEIWARAFEATHLIEGARAGLLPLPTFQQEVKTQIRKPGKSICVCACARTLIYTHNMHACIHVNIYVFILHIIFMSFISII